MAEEDEEHLALGLATILSDPGHISTLIALGESRIRPLHDILLSRYDSESDEEDERRYRALVESKVFPPDVSSGYVEWVRLQYAPEEEQKAAARRQFAAGLLGDLDEDPTAEEYVRLTLAREGMTIEEARAFVASGPVGYAYDGRRLR